MSQALQGLRVLDFSRVLSGPFATMTLADLGADVVKIEQPDGGDDTRAFGPPFADGVSTYFLAINRGKRSFTANLRDPQERERVLALADVADVVIENFRPGVMDKLGLGYETLRARNPKLIYCSISGFGRDSREPGYDLVIQGLSGVPSITGDGQTPWKCGASIADLVAGMNAVQGILAALVRRERTGEGALIDVSMLRGQLALLTYHASGWLNAGAQPRAVGNAHPSIHPFGTYLTATGWLNLAVGNDSQFAQFCQALGVSWHTDPRFLTIADRVRHREALDALISPALAAAPLQHWLDLLSAVGIPCGPMCSVPEALERAAPLSHPHPQGAGQIQTLPPGFTLDNAPPGAARGAPALGAHTAEVLRDWLA